MQAQFTRSASNSATSPIAELTRQNLELWAKMQETLLAAFAPPRDPAREPAQSKPAQPKPAQSKKTAGKTADDDQADSS